MRESAWSEAQTTTRSTLDRPEFPDFFGEGGCKCAKFRHLGIRKRSSERITVLRCCSAAVLQSEGGKRLEVGGRKRNAKCQSSNAK